MESVLLLKAVYFEIVLRALRTAQEPCPWIVSYCFLHFGFGHKQGFLEKRQAN
jgi:hypothetical protein